MKLSPLTLSVSGPKVNDHLDLSDATLVNAGQWLDGRLNDADLAPASTIELPYTLPDDVLASPSAGSISAEELRALAGWYGLAQSVLSELATFYSDVKPGPSPVRCWPHHFDIATYVSLEPGDPESARGIGVGLSPGDST